jgi:hypothetical protein
VSARLPIAETIAWQDLPIDKTSNERRKRKNALPLS